MLLLGVSKTLPGLRNFYMAGQWTEPGGMVPVVAMSGRNAIQMLCHDATDAVRRHNAMSETRDHIARSAGIIAVGNVTSRLLGLVRDQITAGLFGSSGHTDAFFVASNISQIFYDLLINGAVSSALVPVFSTYAGEQQRAHFWRLTSLILNLAIMVLAVVVLLLELATPLLVRIAGPGFSPELKLLAEQLAHITLFAVIFLGSSAVLTAMLYSLQAFVFPAFCSALFNASIIIVAVLFHNQLGVGSLALGMLVGAIAQVLFQLPPLIRRRMHYTFALSIRDADVRQILLLYAPVALGLVVSAVQVLIDRNLASRDGEGSISSMQYATRLIQFPLGLIPTAIAGASLPVLSQRSGNNEQFKQTLATSLRLIIFLILPAATGLAILSMPIVAAIFQHGAFTVQDTQRSTLALLLYLPGLPAAAIDQMLIFAFYAAKRYADAGAGGRVQHRRLSGGGAVADRLTGHGRAGDR